ncbi:MAG: hypothetical protein NVS3B2_11160 [Ramlibacter sp.]
MTTAQMHAHPPADINAIVSSDIMALASHMSDCQRAHGPLLPIISALEWAKGMAFGHIVTTGALVGATGLCLLLALA